MSTATKKRPRAKARKSKIIEIDGHQLTPDLYDQYQRRLEWRQRTNRNMPQDRIKEIALSDVLAKFRFSLSAKTALLELYQQLLSVALGAAALGGYPFHDSHARNVRLCGCDALNRLATEAQLLGAKLHALQDAIRYENLEHLQDWQKRQAAYDAASAYGLPPTVQP